MVWKLAWRNIHGAGLRSGINVFIIAFVLIGIIWVQGMYSGWMHVAERQSRQWENADGRYVIHNYDRYDPFSWDKSNGIIPAELQKLVNQEQAVPVLISPAVIYPEGRMFSIVLKGIPAQQKILKIPTASLADSGAYIPAVIGTNMAKNTLLKQGDTVTLRWRDIHGAFNAADIVIKQVMDTPDLDVDVSQVWIDLSRLQTMKDAPNRATFIMLKNSKGITYRNKDWTYQSIDDLMADLRAIVKLKQAQAMLIYAILLFLAMIAIFDTQVLAVFKRRKEIGTFAALGMTTQQIIRMFTLEGMMYAMLASLAAAILGMPLFVYYGTKGWKLPGSYDSFGIAGFKEPIIFHYSPATILLTFVVIMLITTLVSWIPTLKIARLKPTDALRGRAG